MNSPVFMENAVFVLTFSVIFVNGWTDAPNAIATCVGTRALPLKTAVLMAALCNCLGVVVMCTWSSAVAFSIEGMIDLGGDAHRAAAARGAALAAIVIWSCGAWYFGIPTSESHGLVAGLAGAAIALRGMEGVVWDCWATVIGGLFFSVLLGFAAGVLACSVLARLFAQADRRRSRRLFRRAQIASAAGMAFMHGAQDGQKFLGVLLLGSRMGSQLNGHLVDWLHGVQAAELDAAQANAVLGTIPLRIIMLCALVMALGTAVGGGRIIKAVGMDMARLKPYQGCAADGAAAACLLFASVLGFPVSTTHVKTAAISGAAVCGPRRVLRLSVAGDMVLTWLLTFPACGLLGYVLAEGLLRCV